MKKKQIKTYYEYIVEILAQQYLMKKERKMKYDYRKAMYLWEEEVFLVGDDEPRCVIACVFEDGETIDYTGTPMRWLDVDWVKTNELWESQGKWTLSYCNFEENVRVDFINGSWRLIAKEKDEEEEEL